MASPCAELPQLLRVTAVNHDCATLAHQWTITQPVQGSPAGLFHAGPVFSVLRVFRALGRDNSRVLSEEGVSEVCSLQFLHEELSRGS